MSKYKKEHKKPKKRKPVTGKDLVAVSPDSPLHPLNEMIAMPIYQLYIRAGLYKAGDLSAKGVLNNDYIFDIPGIAKWANTEDNEIVFHPVITSLLERHGLEKQLLANGSGIASLMVGYGEFTYAAITKAKDSMDPNDDVFANEGVIEATNKDYMAMLSTLTGQAVNTFLDTHKEIEEKGNTPTLSKV